MFILLSFKFSRPFSLYWSVSSTTMQEPLSADFIVILWLLDSSLSVFLSCLERLHLLGLGLRWEVLCCIVWKESSYVLLALGGCHVLFGAKGCLDLLLGGCLLKNSIMRSFLMYGWMKLETSLGLCGVMLYFKPLLSSCVAMGLRGVEDKLTM